MLRIADDLAVWWPVKIPFPRDEGKPETLEIKVRFRVAKVSDVKGPLRDLLTTHVLDWAGIGDAEGKPLPFSAEALANVLDYPFMSNAIENALAECSRGAPAKN